MQVVADEAAISAAFHATLALIEKRCRALLALPLDHLDSARLKQHLDRISTL